MSEAEEIGESSDVAPSPKKRNDGETAVHVRGVRKQFGSKVAVDRATMHMRSRRIHGLIGPNGAGKTTTFSMMAGYLKPDEGSVDVLGFDPRNVDALRGRLGVLPQDAQLPASDPVGEFLTHLAKLQGLESGAVEEIAKKALVEVGGADWWSTRCGALSHGMAKRVALAQAMMGSPEVVLLDEPTAGLDPRNAYEVRQLVKTRRGKTTVIISSHNLQELEEICDFAVVLDRGVVVASGKMSELTAASSEVRITLKMSRRDHGGNTFRIPESDLPLPALREIAGVTAVIFEGERNELVLNFDKKLVEAEVVIGFALSVLLQRQMLISGVGKGRGLEARVMDLTD